jgi:hypothetical protein
MRRRTPILSHRNLNEEDVMTAPTPLAGGERRVLWDTSLSTIKEDRL